MSLEKTFNGNVPISGGAAQWIRAQLATARLPTFRLVTVQGECIVRVFDKDTIRLIPQRCQSIYPPW